MHLFRPENRGKPSVFQGFILKIRSISYSFYGYFDSCPFLLLLHTDICFTILAVGLIGAFFAIPPAMLSSYQHSYKGKVDFIYSTIVIYLIICVTFQLIIEHYVKEIFRYMLF